MKDCAQLGQHFRRRIGAWSLVRIERQLLPIRCAVVSDLVDLDFERHDTVVLEATGGLRCQRALVAAIREGVSFFARDTVLARDVFSGQSHAEVYVRVVLDKIWIWSESRIAAQH